MACEVLLYIGAFAAFALIASTIVKRHWKR